jgi:hypothetical protein
MITKGLSSTILCLQVYLREPQQKSKQLFQAMKVLHAVAGAQTKVKAWRGIALCTAATEATAKCASPTHQVFHNMPWLRAIS